MELLVTELAKSTYNMERLEAIIAKTTAEKGDLCDDLRLLTRYLKDHRRNFYRAMKQIADLRKLEIKGGELEYKFHVEASIREFQAETRRVEVAMRAAETNLFSNNPNGIKYLCDMINIDRILISTR
jgi:hypothetical protein